MLLHLGSQVMPYEATEEKTFQLNDSKLCGFRSYTKRPANPHRQHGHRLGINELHGHCVRSKARIAMGRWLGLD
jgi:hypothetical protein